MRESPSKVGRVPERGRNVVGEKSERGVDPRRGHRDLLRASTQKGLVLLRVWVIIEWTREIRSESGEFLAPFTGELFA